MKTNRLLCFLLALTVAVTAFIFYQSLRGPEESNASSGTIVEIVEPALEYLAGKGNWDANFLVRKGGHLSEYCALGAVVMLTAIQLCKRSRTWWFGFAFFYVLAAAVTDEFIQSFTGRSSMVSDVLIDFAGAMIGFCLVAVIRKLCKSKEQKKHDEN